MASPTSGPLRLARALAVTAVVLGLAAGAHVAAGSALPPPTVLGMLGALVLAGSVVATRTRLGLVAVGCLLGIGQVALHHALALLATSPACAPATAPAADAGHAHHAGHAPVAAGCATQQEAVTAPLDGLGSGLLTSGQLADRAMLLAHVAATLAAALVLLLGERALWWLAAWLRPVIERLATVAHVPEGVLAGATRDRALVAGPQLRPGPAGVRGPPARPRMDPPAPRV